MLWKDETKLQTGANFPRKAVVNIVTMPALPLAPWSCEHHPGSLFNVNIDKGH